MAATTLYIRLTPKASSNRIGETFTDAEGREVLKVYVTAPPEKGKANKALIELLAKEFGVAKSLVMLVHGDTDRNKVVEIDR